MNYNLSQKEITHFEEWPSLQAECKGNFFEIIESKISRRNKPLDLSKLGH